MMMATAGRPAVCWTHAVRFSLRCALTAAAPAAHSHYPFTLLIYQLIPLIIPPLASPWANPRVNPQASLHFLTSKTMV